MKRLSRYLAGLFAADAAALFAVALFLLFLIQCLRIFDVVSVKGQSFFTLLGQALLSMPTLAVVFLYVCVGIGLGRALRSMQSSQELHIVHSIRGLRALLGAVGIYTTGATVIVLVLTNFVEPATTRQFKEWSTSITADLVGRTLRPHRFAEVVPNVNMVIGGRRANGEITDFFVDDNRSKALRRTYIAERAVVAEDDEGYVLQLFGGSIQYMSDEFQFGQVAFERYDLALDRLTGTSDTPVTLDERNSIDLLVEGLRNGELSRDSLQLLIKRVGEGLRVAAICLFVTAVAAFPHGRRGGEVPIELVVLGAAFLERGVASLPDISDRFGPLAGTCALLLLSVIVLLYRLRVHRPVWRRSPA